jgi:hypothetical protein
MSTAAPEVRDCRPLLSHYSIYDRPADHPEEIVCREWLLYPGGQISPGRLLARGQSLEAVRAHVPRGLVCLEPFPGDVACLIETWI